MMLMMKKRAAIYLAPLLLFGSAPVLAAAQSPAAPAPPPASAVDRGSPARGPEAGRSALADRRMAMTEKVTAADFKQIEGGPLLIAAYCVVWLVFFGVLVYTLVRVRRVGDEVRRLEAQLQASKSEGA